MLFLLRLKVSKKSEASPSANGGTYRPTLARRRQLREPQRAAVRGDPARDPAVAERRRAADRRLRAPADPERRAARLNRPRLDLDPLEREESSGEARGPAPEELAERQHRL